MLRRSILVSALTVLCLRSPAQSVISARSGLIHFFEGAISIDGRNVPPIRGRFVEIPEGSLLNTNDGKAEILLGPEIFLWLGPNSTIRMQRNSLTDARVELLEGSAIVESTQLLPDNAVTLIQRDSDVRVSAHSLYRIDASLSELTVFAGQGDVTNDQGSLVINARYRYTLSSGVTIPLPTSKPDALEQWVQERKRSITAANLTAGTEDGSNTAKNRPRRSSPGYPAATVPVPRRTW